MTTTDADAHTPPPPVSTGIWVIDADGRIRFVDSGLCRLLGASPRELLGTPLQDYLSVESRDILLEIMADPDSAHTMHPEVIFQPRSGEPFPARLAIGRVAGDGTIPDGIAGFITASPTPLSEVLAGPMGTHFRRVFEHLTAGMVLVDRKGRILAANGAFCEFIGYSETDLLNRTVFDITHPDDRTTSREQIDRLQHGNQQQFSLEKRYVRPDGSIVWALASVAHVLDTESSLAANMAIIHDITARKRMEQALRESEEKYRLLVEHQTDLVVKVDPEGRFLFVSPSYCETFGKTQEELLGQTFMPLVHEQDQEPTRQVMEQLYQPPYTCYLEQRAMTRHGWRWLAWADRAILDESGRVTAIVGVGRDVTDRRRAEEQLLDREMLLRRVLDVQPHLICLVDENQTILLANQALAEHYGVSIEEMEGVSQPELHRRQGLPAEELDHGWQDNRDVLQTGHPLSVLEYHHDSAGKGNWYRSRKVPVTLVDGRRAILVVAENQEEIKVVEQTLRESNARHSSLIELMNDGFAMGDAAGRFTYVNHRLCEMLGYSREEMIDQPAVEFMEETSRRQFAQRLQQRQQGAQDSYELAWKTRSGEILTTLVSPTPIFDSSGKLKGSFAVITDISGWKETQEQIRRSEERYRSLFETMHQGVLYHDRNGRILAANSSAMEILGLSAEEITSRTTGDPRWKALQEDLTEFPLDERPSLKALRNGKPVRNVVMGVFNPREQEYRWIVINAVPQFRKGESQPFEIHTTFTDITDRKRSEIEISRLAAIVDSSTDAIIGKDLNGIIMSWNRGAEKIYGYTAAEVIGRPISILAPADRADEIPEIINRVAQGESIDNFETVRICKNGREIDVSLTISPIRDPAGRIIAASTIARDITEHKRLEKQLFQAQKMEALGTLTGGIAHDFNNLLTIIQGYTDLVLTQANPADPLYSDMEEIRDAAVRAAGLTRQLLIFSRRQPMHFAPQKINRIIRNLMKMLTRLLGEDIEVQTSLTPADWTIWADPANIEQVIMNLSINARDAMPDGGKLIISTENVVVDQAGAGRHTDARPGRFIRVIISDTGCGMDPAVLNRVFDPFFTTKEAGKGTGLGLAVVYGIIQQHEGWIVAESEPGHGSRFTIYLPAHVTEVSEEQRNGTRLHRYRGNGERILMIEDEEGIRKVGETILGASNYRVRTAATATEGEAIFHQTNGAFDLVICDVVLPDRSGLEVVDTLRSLEPRLGILMASGYTDEKSRWEIIEERGYLFLQKPYTLDELLRHVHLALGHPE